GSTISITGSVTLGGGRTLQIDSGASATLPELPPFPTRRSSDLATHPATHVENAGSFSVTTGDIAPVATVVEDNIFHNTGTFTKRDRKSTILNSSHYHNSTASASANTLLLTGIGAGKGSFSGSGE